MVVVCRETLSAAVEERAPCLLKSVIGDGVDLRKGGLLNQGEEGSEKGQM